MTVKKFSLLALLAAFQVSASAQEVNEEVVKFHPHWYLQVQGGASYTRGETSFGDLLSPAGQVAVGYRFDKVLGVRLHGEITEGKGGMVSPDAKYSFYSAGAGLDLHADLSTLVCGYNPKRVFNVGAFIGGGANIAWSNGRANRLANMGYELLYVWDGTKVRPFGRAGVDVNFRISNRVSLGLEGNANIISDKFNSKNGENADWYFNVLAGVKVALGKTYTKTVREPMPVVVTPVEEPRKEEVKKEEPKTETVKVVKETRTDIFFKISSSYISDSEQIKMLELVRFLKDNADAKVTLTGYADSGTGNPRVNMKYAEDRVAAVKSFLINAGISADRVSTVAKGDTEQPFTENAKNRVCICVAK